MHIRKIILLAEFAFFLSYFANSQCGTFSHKLCDSIPFITCNVSDLINLGFCTLADPADYNPDNDLQIPDEIPDCTSNGNAFRLQNPKWYSFIATDTQASIELLVQACNGSQAMGEDGLQYALISNCSTLEIFDCESGSQGGGFFETLNIEYTGLSIGKTYFFVVDGFAGSICTYRFNDIVGFGDFVLEDINDVIFEHFPSDTVCAGIINTTIRLDTIPGDNLGSAEITSWQIFDLMDMSTPILDTVVNGITFDYQFQLAGDFELQVQASNSCLATNLFTKQFVVAPIEEMLLDTFTFCVEDLADTIPDFPNDPRYMGDAISGIVPNPFRDTIIQAEGCPFIQIVPLNPIMPTLRNDVELVYCNVDTAVYEGIEFTHSVYDTALSLEGLGREGCDSLIELSLTILRLEGSILPSMCDDGSSTLTFIADVMTPINEVDSILYIWTDSGGSLVTDGDMIDSQLVVTQQDSFFLEVKMYKYGQDCSFFAEVFADPVMMNLNLECLQTGPGSINISWNELPGISEYIVLESQDTLSIQNDTTYSIDGLPPGSSVNLQVIAISSAGCDDVVSAITCDVMDCPDIILEINEGDTLVCMDGSNAMMGFSYSLQGNSGTGELEWSSSGLIDNETGVFDLNGNGPGEYEIILQYTEGPCFFTDTIGLELGIMPISNFEIDSQICQLDTAMVVLDQSPAISTVLNWNIEGNHSFRQISDSIFLIHWEEAGTFNVELSIEDGPCFSGSFTKTIIIEKSLDALQINCNSFLDRLEFSWNAIDCANEYEVSLNGDFVTMTQDTFYTIDSLTQGESIEINVVAVSDCICPNSSQTLECEAQLCPDITINLEEVGDICFDPVVLEPINLNIEITGNSGAGVGAWTGTGVDENGIFDPVAAGIGIHQIVYTFTEESCDFVDEIDINILETPQLEVIVTSPVCPGDSVGNLEIIATGGQEPYTYFIDSIQIPDPVVNALEAGTYVVAVRDQNSCSQILENIVIPNAPSGQIDLSGSTTITEGQSVSYNISTDIEPSDINSVLWSLNGNSLCEDITCLLNYEFAPHAGGLLCVDLFFNDICVIGQCIEIELLREFTVYVPNIFNPKADNQTNKVFWVYSNDPNAVVEDLTIFDRWGNTLYSVNQIAMEGAESAGWDGTHNGEMLNPGVYVYIAEVRFEDGSSKLYSGDLTLIY